MFRFGLVPPLQCGESKGKGLKEEVKERTGLDGIEGIRIRLYATLSLSLGCS